MTSSEEEEEEIETFSLSNALDSLIIMHREAHFSGKFEFMLDYYEKEGKGVCPDIEIKRIQELASMEEKMEQNLAPLMLSGTEAEKVAHAKDAYKALRDLYEVKNPKNAFPLLIADLILSEEEDPKKEIEAIVSQGEAIVPLLVDLLKAQDFSDPLFPGYGQVPLLTIKCLGKIGDQRAMISLFEAIGEGDFDNEEILLEAIHAIGEPAKKFLLKVLQRFPLNVDNERAALALINFKKDPDVSEIALSMLEKNEVRKDFALSTYLILCCEGLMEEKRRQDFMKLAEDLSFKCLKQDIRAVANMWK